MSEKDAVELYTVPAKFDHGQRVAKMFATLLTIPKHLQGNVAECFLVYSQALRWGMDPVAVMQHTYVLQGKLGYEGKLVAAVVNGSPDLKTKLNYEYTGSGQQREVRVFGTLRGEDKPREVRGTVAAWRTANGQWNTQTDQMLSYRGAREWARRHMPETLLGVYADDELPDVIRQVQGVVEVTPTSLADFGEVVSASNDPKVEERRPSTVDAVVTTDSAGFVSAEDAELAKLFGTK